MLEDSFAFGAAHLMLSGGDCQMAVQVGGLALQNMYRFCPTYYDIVTSYVGSSFNVCKMLSNIQCRS